MIIDRNWPCLDVRVPRQENSPIWRGSAIVSRPAADGLVVDYQGRVEVNEGMRTFEGRLLHASERSALNYPTSSRMWVDEGAMRLVGRAVKLPFAGWVLSEILDEAALADWLDGEPVPPVGGSPELLMEAANKVVHRFANRLGWPVIGQIVQSTPEGQSPYEGLVLRAQSIGIVPDLPPFAGRREASAEAKPRGAGFRKGLTRRG